MSHTRHTEESNKELLLYKNTDYNVRNVVTTENSAIDNTLQRDNRPRNFKTSLKQIKYRLLKIKDGLEGYRHWTTNNKNNIADLEKKDIDVNFNILKKRLQLLKLSLNSEDNTMHAKVLKDYDISINDFKYSENQIIKITQIYGFDDKYAIFHNLETGNVLDFIPKDLVEII